MKKSRKARKDLGVRPAGAATGDHGITVYCTLHDRQVSMEEVRACDDCDGFSLDPTGRSSLLMCNHQPSAEATPHAAVAPGLADAGHTPVASLMTRHVITVETSTSVERLTELFLENSISGAPVIDETGRPIGIVTKTDLIREHHEHEGDIHEDEPLRIRLRRGMVMELGKGFHEEVITRATVGDIMTPIAFTVPEASSLGEAAALMSREGVHRVVVTAADGKVSGILSALDVLRWVAGVIAPPSK